MDLPQPAATTPAAEPPPAALPSPGWPHQVAARFEQLPGPRWVRLLATYAVSALVMHSLPWAIGTVPLGAFDPASAFWGVLVPVLLWISTDLERAVTRAFDAFRPALTLSAEAAERLRYDLQVVPARPALLVTAAAVLANVGSFASDPVTYTIGVPVPIAALVFAYQLLAISLLFEVLWRMVRQAKLIRRTLDADVVIDVFRPGALHAFATLAARPGVLISLMVAASIPFNPPVATLEAFLVGTAPYLFGAPIISIVAFALPLAGAHERLAEQKARLQAAAEARLQATLDDLNRDVDAKDVTRADGLNKFLASLVLQRDILAKLPTWPWAPGTLRGFASAVLLPLAVFLAQQALSRFF